MKEARCGKFRIKNKQVVKTESTEALLWEPSWLVTGTKNIMGLEDAGWQVDSHKVNWNGSWNHATEQKSHHILQIKLPSIFLTEYLKLPNCHSLRKVGPSISNNLTVLKFNH